MADRPFRLQILDAMTATLQGITTDNGYNYDLAESVFRGRAIFGDDDPLPLLSILEVPVPPDQIQAPPGSGTTTGDWDLIVQGFIEDDSENPTDPAHFLMADVKKALAVERKRRTGPHNMDMNILGMEGRVEDLSLGAGTVRPPDEISAVAYFWLPVTLKIVEDNENPYL